MVWHRKELLMGMGNFFFCGKWQVGKWQVAGCKCLQVATYHLNT
jgi:hypothetical protein